MTEHDAARVPYIIQGYAIAAAFILRRGVQQILELVVAQGDERIDGERAAGRDVAGEQRDREKHDRHADEGPRIDGADSKEQADE